MSTSDGQHRWDGFGDKTREARLRWYGHVLRKDDGHIGRRMLRMELPGKRTGDGKSAVATPDGKKPKQEEEEVENRPPRRNALV